MTTVTKEVVMAQMPKFQIRVPQKEKDLIEEIAKEKGISPSELSRRLLSKALREKHYEKV